MTCESELVNRGLRLHSCPRKYKFTWAKPAAATSSGCTRGGSLARAMAEATVALLSPASLPKVLGEALVPGVKTVALLNRSGLLLGCAGDASTASSLAAIVSTLWQGHEKCEGFGNLGCLLLECEHGRLAVKAVGSFIIACCSDETVVCGQPGKR